ncbi:hypothetical protein Vadar_005623 [Vaccinium darrowii]|uniref:Uncharacterized protein n=1 Tax=Vaccinium darrowii TaxID=229202 RepID=A0ACB7XWU0_9ERIC|nr:hypothetical protein Vadar_005623 [Vaccinium darrowii]
MASSSKSPSAHHHEDLSATDVMVEESVHNEVRLSKSKQNPYPYPEHLKVEELVPNVLQYPSFSNYVEWNKKYVEWRQKMLEVITRAGLLGFIDGTVQAPPETVSTSVNKEYVAWKRSDDVVREWIWKRLNSFFSMSLGRFESAKELWEEIARTDMNFIFFPPYCSSLSSQVQFITGPVHPRSRHLAHLLPTVQFIPFLSIQPPESNPKLAVLVAPAAAPID